MSAQRCYCCKTVVELFTAKKQRIIELVGKRSGIGHVAATAITETILSQSSNCDFSHEFAANAKLVVGVCQVSERLNAALPAHETTASASRTFSNIARIDADRRIDLFPSLWRGRADNLVLVPRERRRGRFRRDGRLELQILFDLRC